MNFDNFTIKSQEVVQQAVQTAQQNGNQAIEPEHLLKALLDREPAVADTYLPMRQQFAIVGGQRVSVWR